MWGYQYGIMYLYRVSQKLSNILVVRACLWLVYHVTEAVQAVW